MISLRLENFKQAIWRTLPHYVNLSQPEMPALQKISSSAFKAIEQIIGKPFCSRAPEDLVAYGYDATGQAAMPDAVVFPKTADEVSQIMEIASAQGFAVVPRGAGSGLTGGAIPVYGGLVLSTSRMDRIVRIDTENLLAVVEPGVITAKFHAEVEQQRLFYPPDPASSEFSTLGGNMAECAGGPRAVKYGVTRDYVLGLEVVLPTGEIIHTGVSTVKGVVGYDLTRLIVGSEGTLGIITQMTLRLIPLPESVRTLTAVFDEMETAVAAVSKIIQSGVVPRTIEYMDHICLVCVENHLKMGLPVKAGALLLTEVDGKENEVDAAMDQLEKMCVQQGAKDIQKAATPEAAKQLWLARKSINPALFRHAPHKINEDIVVPRNRMPEAIRRIKKLMDETGLTIATFGHAGDGNIHVNIMLDKNNPDQLEKANAAVGQIFDYTLALGGTISGEHGVGVTKQAYIETEIGQKELALMKGIKKTFDPGNILNPGKIFPQKPSGISSGKPPV